MMGILKFAGRWALRGLIVLVILVVALVLLKDRIFQSWVESRLKKSTGMELTLRHAEFSLASGQVKLEGLVIYNPAEFGGQTFINLEELKLEMDRAALKQRQLHFRLLRINMAELNIVEDKQGKLNLQAIQAQLERKKKEDAKPGKPNDGKASSPMGFGGIDTLNLTLGKVRKINLNYPDKPVVTDLNVRDEVMTDIKTQEDFQNKVLPVLLRGGVAVVYQMYMESRAPKPPPQ